MMMAVRRRSLWILFLTTAAESLSVVRRQPHRASSRLRAEKSDEYVSPVVEFLGRGLRETTSLEIDWAAPKAELSAVELAAQLEAGLREREWFVTGRVLPELFADDFRFEDPDVKIAGIRNYAEGVRKLFDASSRAEVVRCDLEGTVVKVKWRLSGRVNVGPFGLDVKPYIVDTDLTLREDDKGNCLVVFQEDRFTIPSWDILLSAVAPWLPFLAPPAPPVVDDQR